MALVYAGCVVRQPVEIQTKFDYSEHKPYMETGENGLKGQGFLRQQGGGIVTCAGREVLLVPATSFFREAVTAYRLGKNPQFTEKVDPAFKPIIKRSQCDVQGNFAFGNLPAGKWFITTQVSWIVNRNTQGGTLMREVTLSNNETIQVLLTEKDFIAR